MAGTIHTKTDQVLATARKELRAQLAVVRDEMSRLAGEEQALAHALSNLDGDGVASSTTPPMAKAGGTRAAKRSAGRSSSARAGTRRRRAAGKSTAERVNELQQLLAGGPKSRNDLAAALKVSPARVQQLLAELGDSVSSQQDPARRQGKLWALTGRADGASATKATATRRRTKGKATRKPAARRTQAAK